MKQKPMTKIKMSKVQKKAEEEAVRTLNQALILLEQNDENVDQAQKLRYYVTQELLPTKKMYIVGEHPKSLLKQVDRRIEQAHIRLLLNDHRKTDNHPKVPPSTLLRNQRYQEMSRRMNHQFSFSLVLFFLIALSMFFLMFYMHNYSSQGFSNAFQWLSR